MRAAVLALALVLGLAGPVGAQQELLAQGNQRYQDGDYAAAVQAYQGVIQGGFESADLYYNLGNAWFKSGDLGRAILAWERARALRPHDADVAANLELARSLTADDVHPMPRFWLLSVVSWWVDLIPRTALIGAVGLAWLALMAGLAVRILAPARAGAVGRWLAIAGAVVVLVLGTNLAVRELGIGRHERAVILATVVPVRSAPSDDDDLTLFEVHEGTTVRVDQTSDTWAEIVLDDGKVGWIPTSAFEVI